MNEHYYYYFYDGIPIPQQTFDREVPEGWEKEVDEFGQYSWGYFRASRIDVEDTTNEKEVKNGEVM